MGRVRNLLSSITIRDKADRYSDMYSIERCEDFHIHWRNLRLQFSKPEFQHFCESVRFAYEKWQGRGMPDPEPTKTLPEYYQKNPNKIDPVHGINPDNFRIEDDDLNGEAVHVHYRSVRLEFSHEEFLELADEFTMAAEKLRKIRG